MLNVVDAVAAVAAVPRLPESPAGIVAGAANTKLWSTRLAVGLPLNEPLTIIEEACPVPLTAYVYTGSEFKLCNPPPTIFIDANFK
jgi:hypothetical protein